MLTPPCVRAAKAKAAPKARKPAARKPKGKAASPVPSAAAQPLQNNMANPVDAPVDAGAPPEGAVDARPVDSETQRSNAPAATFAGGQVDESHQSDGQHGDPGSEVHVVCSPLLGLDRLTPLDCLTLYA